APDTAAIGPTDSPKLLQVSPSSVTIETSQRVQFRGQMATSKRGPSYVPVIWEASGGSIRSDGTFSSSVAGTFKVVGRGRGRKGVDSSVVVVVPPPTDLVRVAVTPDPVAVNPGVTRTFTATGYLADGSSTALGVNWTATGGDIDPAGAYLAGSVAGSYRVIATNTAGTLADTADVSINALAP